MVHDANVEETTGYLETLLGIMYLKPTACVVGVMMTRDDSRRLGRLRGFMGLKGI